MLDIINSADVLSTMIKRYFKSIAYKHRPRLDPLYFEGKDSGMGRKTSHGNKTWHYQVY